MEKIIVRNKVLRKGLAVSNYIQLTADYNFNSFDEFINEYGLRRIMKELFDEEITNKPLNETIFFEKYHQIVFGKINMHVSEL